MKEFGKMYESLPRKALGEESVLDKQNTKPAFICLNLTTEIQEQGVKYV